MRRITQQQAIEAKRGQGARNEAQMKYLDVVREYIEQVPQPEQAKPKAQANIKEPYTLDEIKAKIASQDYSAELMLQHAMLLLDASTAAALQARVAELETTSENLKLQAQIHAQEARTANATIAKIYQCVTGATGEPGNWHGAEPVRRRIAELEAQLLEAQVDAERYRWLRDGELSAEYPYPVMRVGGAGFGDRTIWENELDAAIDAARSKP